ncbi:VanZ family protein [Methylomonas rapida]|uniref:VanZ family protein n=1 Tax=Methylomonas rapida TaxID=2963939 RepID=A0ABY7GM48_9GAMM|nr:VanZ family protein [Methylomonas rapida]WAR45570.1 VanZ family protein [Methylomonas rapida]
MQKLLFYWVVFFITYGSLYPFEFSLLISSQSRQAFLDSMWTSSSIGDVIGNIVLFMPFGFLGYRIFPFWGVAIIGLLLAFVLQLAQLFLPSREPALYDVYWNFLGIGIGLLCAYLLKAHELFHRHFGLADKQAAIGIIMLWGASQLLPFVPTLDWQAYKNALKPLLMQPSFAWEHLSFLMIAWLSAGYFAEKILDKNWRTGYFTLGILSILVLKIVVVTSELTLNDVIASFFAILLYPLLSRMGSRRAAYLAWMMLFTYAITRLSPLQWQSESKSFNWLPFSGFLDGSMIVNSRVLAEKLFVFSGIFTLFKDIKTLSIKTISAVAIVVTLIEICQLWLVGRTAEITDPLLVVIIAWLIVKLSNSTRGEPMWQPSPMVRAAAHILGTNFDAANVVSGRIVYDKKISLGGGHFQVIVSGLMMSMGIAFCFYVLLRMPNVPYNIKELFKYHGNGIDLFIFALALLSVGAGPAWVGRNMANAKSFIFSGPITAIKVTVMIYCLFFFSVTEESIMDIAGSSVLVHRVGEKGVLGELGKQFVATVGADNLRNVTDIFEPIVRFGALLGPLIIFLGILFAAIFKSLRVSEASYNLHFFLLGKFFIIYFLYMLPWFYFCKVIAFDWSSTDNLNELIAPDGYYGLGGGGYLYMLFGLIATCVAWFSWMLVNPNAIKILAVMGGGALSILPGWLLINAGLTDNVAKYGLTFSGVDFLLGPDRTHLLSRAELFLRWSLLQYSAILGLAAGATLFLRWQMGLLADKNRFLIKSTRLNNSIMTELCGELEFNQVEFVNDLARQMGKSFSATVELIISFVKKEMLGFQSVLNIDAKNIKYQYPIQKEKLLPVVLELSPRQMKVITEIKVDYGIGCFDVIGWMINVFMFASKVEANNKSDIVA